MLVCQNCNQAFQHKEQFQSHIESCSQFIIFCKRCNSHLANLNHKCKFGVYVENSGINQEANQGINQEINERLKEQVSCLVEQNTSLRYLLQIHTDINIEEIFKEKPEQKKKKKKIIYRSIIKNSESKIRESREEEAKGEEKKDEKEEDNSSSEEPPDIYEFVKKIDNLFETLKQK